MTLIRFISVLSCVSALIGCTHGVARAQAPVTDGGGIGEADVVRIATFQDARSVAIDPHGRLYVADAGANVVVQLDPLGQVMQTLGGLGAREGQFDSPSDVDPTNGLVWIVADTENSRLQRFSRASLFLGAQPVGRGEAGTADDPGAATYGIGAAQTSGEADGRPVAVASSPSRETFAVDAARNVVLKWDASQRFERVIGGFEAGEGSLLEPVDLAVSGGRLYVADRGDASVAVYDVFGGFERRLLPGRAVDVQAITPGAGRLYVVLPERVFVLDARGTLLQSIGVMLREALVGVVPSEHGWYLLTPTRLLRVGE